MRIRICQLLFPEKMRLDRLGIATKKNEVGFGQPKSWEMGFGQNSGGKMEKGPVIKVPKLL